MVPETIQTERLELRPFTAADGDPVVAILGDFEVSKWLAKIPHPFTHADLRLENEGGSSRWPTMAAITRGSAVVGGVSATPAHFGYWIAPAYHGKGFATEAGRAMLRLLFGRSDADAVRSGYFEGNHASRRVLEKLGFAEVGRSVIPCRARGQDMPNRDMSLSRADWEAGP